jgi:hypothetical protein
MPSCRSIPRGGGYLRDFVAAARLVWYIASFQGNDACCKLNKNHNKFKEVDVNEIWIGRLKLATALDSIHPVHVKPEFQSFSDGASGNLTGIASRNGWIARDPMSYGFLPSDNGGVTKPAIVDEGQVLLQVLGVHELRIQVPQQKSLVSSNQRNESFCSRLFGRA